MTGRKFCYLDMPTQIFLNQLKFRREVFNYSVEEIAKKLSVSTSTILNYESRQKVPILKNLMKLANLLDYDLSNSVNYKFFYKMIDKYKIKKNLHKYGYSYEELSKEIFFDKSTIYDTLQFGKYTSLKCLAAILDILQKEKTKEVFKEKILRSIRKKRKN